MSELLKDKVILTLRVTKTYLWGLHHHIQNQRDYGPGCKTPIILGIGLAPLLDAGTGSTCCPHDPWETIRNVCSVSLHEDRQYILCMSSGECPSKPTVVTESTESQGRSQQHVFNFQEGFGLLTDCWFDWLTACPFSFICNRSLWHVCQSPMTSLMNGFISQYADRLTRNSLDITEVIHGGVFVLPKSAWMYVFTKKSVANTPYYEVIWKTACYVIIKTFLDVTFESFGQNSF